MYAIRSYYENQRPFRSRPVRPREDVLVDPVILPEIVEEEILHPREEPAPFHEGES